MKRFLKYDTEDAKNGVINVNKEGLLYFVQPDWNQNDETQPDYVKNRPFYENALVSVQYPGAPGAAWYKVSDSVPTGDHSVGASCTTSLSIGGEKKTGPIEICEDDYYLSVDANVIVILKDNVTISGVGITFPKKGTYFLRSDRGFISGFALGADADPEITWDGNTSEIKTLDEKFIPDVSGLIVKSSTPDSTKKFRITVDDSGTISATEVS